MSTGSVSISFYPPVDTGNAPPILGYTVTVQPGNIVVQGTASPITVPGLTFGVQYTYSIVATNKVGASIPVTGQIGISSVPGAATNLVATPEPASAIITFTAAPTNGQPITGYVATSSPGGQTGSAADSPISVTGLTNGTAYTFTIVATNLNGGGPASAPSNSVTPEAIPTAPGAPTSVAAVAGTLSAVVSFTAPAANGSAITGYTVTSNTGGHTGTGTASPITVSGLTAETAYTFTVTATNAIGTGPASAASNSVTPYTVPGAPTGVVGTPGNAQVSVGFTAPADNGGSTITGYTAVASPGGLTGTGASSPIVVTGLANGTAYTFTVTATNAAGNGAASTPSSAVTPVTVPSAPLNPVGTAGNGQVSVSFNPPASNGGSAILTYTATSTLGGFSATGASSPLTVTGLANGTAYSFTVTAANAQGTGPASVATSQVTPAPVVPSAPLSPSATAGNGQAIVNFSAPASNGGLPIFNYTVTANPGGASGSNGQSPVTVTGLTNGVAYTFTVTAQNGAGTGPASVASNSVTPSTVPGIPTGVVATAGNAQVSIAFVAPNNGGSPITGYTATSTQGGIQFSGTASPIVVTGLTNGNPYTFNVYATNANGNGLASNSSNPVTPATVPSAPQSPVATPGNASASVAFGVPASNGGSTISGYTAISSPGNHSASGASSPITVPGLTNGTAYTFTVTATNAIGTGPASVATLSVTPSAPAGFVITTTALPSGAIGITYNGTVVASGSSFTPYTYANTSALPAGLTLNASTGAITGTPTAGGAVTTGFQATDSSGTTTTPVATIVANNNGSGQAGVPGDTLTTTSSVSLTANGPVMFFGTVATYNAAHNARTLTASPAIPSITAEQVIEGPTSASNPNAINASQETDMWWCTGTPGGVTTFTNYWGSVGDSDFLAAWGVQHPVGTTLVGTNSNFQTGTQWAGVSQGTLLTSGYITVTSAQVPCRLYGFCENTSGLGSNFLPTVGVVTPQGGSPLGTMALLANVWNFATSQYTTCVGYIDITAPGNYEATFNQPSSTAQCSQTFGWIVQGPTTAGAVTPIKNLTITIAGAAVPTAPLSPSAVGGNAQAVVTFSPPTSNGGSAITSYTATSNPGNISSSAAGSPITATGLTNGVAYTFTVTASNSVGQGPPSVATAAVTPATVPSGPQDVVATAGSGQATVTYAAPLSTGGNAITGYHATAVPGGANTSIFTPTPVPITVTGLTNGTAYTIGVHAFNNIGPGSPDVQSNSVTPMGATGTPAAQALAYMKSIQGSKILVGQHTQYFEGNTNDETQAYTSVTPLYSLTGQLPAIIGVTANWYGTSDPYNNSGGGQPSLNVVSQIINDWVSTSNNSHKAQNAAGIVQINWGQLNPVGNSNNFVPISSSQLASTVTPGSSAYNNLANQTAELQAYLKSVVATNPNIVIIIRLFAELNGNFLWYGVQNSQTDVNNQILMHQQVFNNLFNGTTLRNNVLVAYDANGYGSYGAFGPMSAWPGQGYADMAGIDVYNQTWSGSNGSIQAGTVTAMNALGVPLIFCECAVDNGASNPVSNPTFSVDNNLIPNWIRASGRNFVAYVQWNDNGNNANNGGTNLPGNIPGSMSICLQNNASFVMNAVDIVNLIELPSFT